MHTINNECNTTLHYIYTITQKETDLLPFLIMTKGISKKCNKATVTGKDPNLMSGEARWN